MAGTPSLVAGTLTNRLGRPIRWWRARAEASVPVGVAGQGGGHLQGDEAVAALRSSYNGRSTASAPSMS